MHSTGIFSMIHGLVSLIENGSNPFVFKFLPHFGVILKISKNTRASVLLQVQTLGIVLFVF